MYCTLIRSNTVYNNITGTIGEEHCIMLYSLGSYKPVLIITWIETMAALSYEGAIVSLKEEAVPKTIHGSRKYFKEAPV